MRRLIFSDLKGSFAAWSGLMLVAIAAGCIGEFAALLMFNAPRANTDSLALMLTNAASMLIVFSSIAAIPVLILASGLFVSEKRKTYALWRLAYLSSYRIMAIVLIQVSLIAIVGAAVGILIMGTLFDDVFLIVFSSRDTLLNVDLAVSFQDAPIVCAVVLMLFLIGSFGKVHEISRFSPIEVLRGNRNSPKSKLQNAITSGLLILVLFIMFRVMKTSSFEVSSMIAMLVPIVVTLLLGASSNIILPLMLQLWTTPIRNSSYITLLLACNRALYNIRRSVSTEAAIMILVCLVTGIYSALSILESCASAFGIDYGSGFDIDVTLSLLMFGGPVILGVISAVVAMLVSSRTQEDESGFLLLLGMSRSRIALCVICEALIHVATALFCGLAGGLVSVALICIGMNVGTPFALRAFPALAVAAFGFIVIVSSMLVPTCLSFRPSFLSRFNRI